MNDRTVLADPASKIMTLEKAVEWREKLREMGETLVVTNGCFDLLHRGHAEYLQASRAEGDELLVLINSDCACQSLKGDGRPWVDQYSRAYLLASLACVDAVVIFDAMRCAAELEALAPDIYVKGGDYTVESLDNDERTALEKSGSRIIFKPFVSGFSTTSLMKKITSAR